MSYILNSINKMSINIFIILMLFNIYVLRPSYYDMLIITITFISISNFSRVLKINLRRLFYLGIKIQQFEVV